MFTHNFKYSIKILFKNKSLIFWTFAFPIILATFFNMAFSDIEKNEKLDIIDIAIIDNESFRENQIFKETFQELGNNKSKEQLFKIEYTNEEEARKLLESDKISGYLLLEEKPKVIVSKNGINQTILKYVVEEIETNSEMFQSVSERRINEKIQEEILKGKMDLDYNALSQEIIQETMKMLQNQKIQIKDISNPNLSYTMIEFYTLIAMTCLYGGILGMTSINKCLANMSHNGKRISISPVSKTKLILSSVLASYLVQLIGIVLLFLYTIFIIKVDYGNHLPQIILLTLLGSLAGLSLGVVTSTVVKKNENMKTGIILSITMLGCFLSGMMGITMKYIIDKNIPIINKINPANMITDGFYSLYYYGVQNRFYQNIISLILFSAILIGISIISLRRQKYDSI